MTKYFSEEIKKLEKHQIFVFGSNLAGRHGKGAAKTAVKKFGAIYGIGDGLQGNSYGISTKDRNLKVLSITAIKLKIDKFIKNIDPNLTYFITRIGCGLAGYKDKEIAPLFKNCCKFENVIFPIEWKKYFEET